MMTATVVENQTRQVNAMCELQPDAYRICTSTFQPNKQVDCGNCGINGVYCTDTIIEWKNCNLTMTW